MTQALLTDGKTEHLVFFVLPRFAQALSNTSPAAASSIVRGSSKPSEDGAHPRVKLYKLTPAGRKQITAETDTWTRDLNVQPGATVNVKATLLKK